MVERGIPPTPGTARGTAIVLAALATASLASGARAADSPTQRHEVTIAGLFPPKDVALLSRTLRADKHVIFRVRVPPGDGPHGVLVFINPGNEADLLNGWADVLDRHDLVWIAAENFGNDKPGAQRGLVALLALKHLARTTRLDDDRRYIGGMSGGGKMASQVLSKFPAFFSGALCIVGADPVPSRVLRTAAMTAKRVVFMTGDRDFNHYDVLQVYRSFRKAGLSASRLVDLPGFGHQYPDAAQLDAALALLDRRAE